MNLMSLRRIGVMIAASAALVAAVIGAQSVEVSDAPTNFDRVPATTGVVPAPPVEDIQEDDPRWDCERMGDRGCGVLGTNGLTYVICHDEQARPVLVVAYGTLCPTGQQS